ncbi:MAG: hypothetical protein ACI4Q3_00010 [Kiritimatiellia bacterium]
MKRDWHTPRRCAALLALAAVFTGVGFAVRQAEFNQVGASNHASTWIFFLAGLFAYYAAIVAFAILRKRLNSRRQCDKLAPHFAKDNSKKETE